MAHEIGVRVADSYIVDSLTIDGVDFAKRYPSTSQVNNDRTGRVEVTPEGLVIHFSDRERYLIPVSVFAISSLKLGERIRTTDGWVVNRVPHGAYPRGVIWFAKDGLAKTMTVSVHNLRRAVRRALDLRLIY